MISGKFLSPLAVSIVVCLGWLAWGVVPRASQGRVSQTSEPRYGPTTPGGYYIRVKPRAVTMAYIQRPQITVAVDNASGQPVDDVLVTFIPSEGAFTTASSRTRGGTVVGTFTAASGSDNPRTAFLVATVEDVEVTIFIDIVPAVFSR